MSPSPDRDGGRGGPGTGGGAGAPLPAGTRRLFPHVDPGAAVAPEHRPFLLARLLEEGDGADLRWLAGRVGEAEMAGWLSRHGGRALSHRSRTFWELVLDAPAPPPHPLTAELWPPWEEP